MPYFIGEWTWVSVGTQHSSCESFLLRLLCIRVYSYTCPRIAPTPGARRSRALIRRGYDRQTQLLARALHRGHERHAVVGDRMGGALSALSVPFLVFRPNSTDNAAVVSVSLKQNQSRQKQSIPGRYYSSIGG